MRPRVGEAAALLRQPPVDAFVALASCAQRLGLLLTGVERAAVRELLLRATGHKYLQQIDIEGRRLVRTPSALQMLRGKRPPTSRSDCLRGAMMLQFLPVATLVLNGMRPLSKSSHGCNWPARHCAIASIGLLALESMHLPTGSTAMSAPLLVTITIGCFV